MALVAPEHWSLGFVWSDAEETTLAHADAAVAVGPHWEEGFLRDEDGRLVTTADAGAYDLGFVRLDGALVLTSSESTPPLHTFA